MKRREVLQLVCAAAVFGPSSVTAQSSDRLRRITWVEPWFTGKTDWRDAAEHLQSFGWTRGGNLRGDLHVATAPAQFPKIAKDVVEARPDVIVTSGPPATLAVLVETRTIPVLFYEVADPVGNGIVSNVARPGGNVTGFTSFEPSLGGKWLQLLKEVDPRVRRAAILFNPETARNRAAPFVQEFEKTAAALSVEPILAFAEDASEIEPIVAGLAAEPGGALVVLPDLFTVARRRIIRDAAAKYRVPSVYGTRYMAATGGLIAYGPTADGLFQGIAGYLDRILRGTLPGELPVQAPTKYELVVNLRVAKALGLTIPPTLLARADEVIE
jgi:putative ABC transport system substrate-binding protein